LNVLQGLEPLEGGISADIEAAAKLAVLVAVYLGDKNVLVLEGSSNHFILLLQRLRVNVRLRQRTYRGQLLAVSAPRSVELQERRAASIHQCVKVLRSEINNI
jgi:hypothetical protein